MWTRKLDHAIFVQEEKYDWVDAKSKVFRKFLSLASLVVMTGVIVSIMV